jgi:hypothetical protein
MTIQEMLKKIKDPRRKEGRRYEVSDVLLMCIMAIMSGDYGYREMGRFMKRQERELREVLHLKQGVPSYVTIRDILQRIDYKELEEAFNEWASQYERIGKRETLSIDGKVIRSTVRQSNTPMQNFISIVSVFSTGQGIVLRCGKIENDKESELPKARNVLETLGVKQGLFTMDALHCQRKQ